MMVKVVVWVLFDIVVVIIAVGFLSGQVKGDDNQKLSREEQIEIMRECYIDTKAVFGRDGIWSTEMAITFFHYRTGMMPIAQ